MFHSGCDRANDLDGVRWLGTLFVVGVEIRPANHATFIDNKTGRNRQLPFRVSVEVIKIDTKLPIDRFQVVRKTML